MKKSRKLLAAALSGLMCVSMAVPAFAEDEKVLTVYGPQQRTDRN